MTGSRSCYASSFDVAAPLAGDHTGQLRPEEITNFDNSELLVEIETDSLVAKAG